MSETRTPLAEPLHLLLLKGASYLAAVLLFVGPLAGWDGRLAAIAAVALALVLSRLAQVHRVRGVVLAAGTLLAAGLGLYGERLVGGPVWISRWFGYQTVLSIGNILTFGLLTLSAVFALRALALRWSMFVGLEAATVMVVVVWLFAGHRDSNISQPRFFADWALGAGYEPRLVLLAIGLATSGAISLLLLRSERISKTLTSLALLAVFTVVVFLLLFHNVSDFGSFLVKRAVSQTESKQQGDQNDDQNDGQSDNSNDGRKNNQSEDQSQDQNQNNKNDKKHNHNNGDNEDERDHGDGQTDRDDLSFDPKDWPNKPRPMAIVTLQDDYRPPVGYFYFRQNVYSQYQGGKLVRAVTNGLNSDVPDAFPTGRVQYPAGEFNDQIEQLVPMTISTIAPHVRPFGLANVRVIEARQNIDPTSFERTYFVEAQALTTPKAEGTMPFPIHLADRKGGDANWSDAVRKHYLQGPDDPRYKELAERIIADSVSEGTFKPEYQNSPILRALAIRRWIEKNLVYNLRADHSRAAEPTTDCLFGDRRGYCVHVAHAMCFLLRSVGIVSRVGAGYTCDVGRPGHGSAILLTSVDMHAWCEIHLTGVGWMIIDAALERSESPCPPEVDTAAQSFYGERNREQPDLTPLEPEDEPTPEERGARLVLYVFLTLAMIMALYGVKLWRRVAPRFAPERQLYRLCYRAVIDRLAEVGLIRQFGETREEFAQRVADCAPEFAALTAAHVRRAVGGLESHRRAEWIALEGQVARRIAATASLRRRVLGWINPFTWVGVR